MKKIFIFLAVFSLFGFRACVEEEVLQTIKVAPCTNPSENIITETAIEGEIGQIAGIWVININNNEKKVRCVPCNLPENYKISDRPIKFDASFLEIPPNVRLVGQPIELKRIY